MAEPKLVIDGREYQMPTSFTLGEARVVKRLTGRVLDELGGLSGSDPDWIVALVWIAMHREDATVTVEQVEALDFGDLQMEGQEDEPSPPDGPAQPAPETDNGPKPKTPSTGDGGETGSETSGPETTPGTSGTPS